MRRLSSTQVCTGAFVTTLVAVLLASCMPQETVSGDATGGSTGTGGTGNGAAGTSGSALVDREGRIARVWAEVDPGVHADQVLAEAKRLR